MLSAGLPNITGSFYGRGLAYSQDSMTATGCFYKSAGGSHIPQTVSSTGTTLNMDASRSNAIYGKASTVQPPAIVLIPQIKF